MDAGAKGVPSLDESVFHAPQEIFSIAPSPFCRSGLVAMFQQDFLNGNLGGVFGFETPNYEFSRSFCETLLAGRSPAFAVRSAVMLPELG
jgi:hypothetical protein